MSGSNANLIAEDITQSQRKFLVADVSSLVIDSYVAIGNELMFIKEIVGNKLTVRRGEDGTTADIHVTGAAIDAVNAADDALIELGDDFGFTEERTFYGEKPWAFFSKLPPGGINLHYDQRRWGAILFPVRGKFEVTPQIFATENYTEIERFNFTKSKIHNNGTPVFFDSRVLHAVPTPLDLEEERVVFSVNIHSHPTEFFRKAIDGTWLNKNTENIGVSND